ncbi:MAG: ATP-binding cassette domain-containing protein [Sedimentisphaerales bacterium]|nr:ATP-binding cassette domain-containing protein [Sedimentisphaerales bacterium]
MAIVSFYQVSKEYSSQTVLDKASFEINAGQKVGLIGPNGCGKTTILRLLCGHEQPTEGSITVSGAVRIGYVPQHVDFVGDDNVGDFLLQEHRQLRAELDRAEELVSSAADEQMKEVLANYQHVRDAYDHIGGDHFEDRAAAMLDALGLADRIAQPVSQLSGGEKNVLAMTQALLIEPNLLILDEPGNHLDYMGLAWLEDFLNRFRGAVLVVSHNRYLLDQVVTTVLEVEHGKVNTYPGNYSAYRTIRAERLKAQQSQYEAQQKRIEQLETLVRKFGDIAAGHASDNTWGKRLRSRKSQLEREKNKAIEKPITQQRKVSAHFHTEATQADIAMRIQGYSKSFGERVLFEELEWDIAGQERWALLGPNGSGKTTLLRDIISQGRWEHPVIRIGPSMEIGYCAQEQEVLDGENTVYDELAYLPEVTHEQVLGLLARFLFTDEEVYKKVKNLSGGERNRLQLARLMLLKPNFLILDEPTNHLDIDTREAVEEALKNFAGTLLVVSHDRYFLDEVVDHVAEIRQGELKLYRGNYSDFWRNRQSVDDDHKSLTGRISSRGKNRQQRNAEKEKAGGKAWQERKNQQATLRKNQKQAAQLEKQIAQTEQHQQTLQEQIAQAYTQGDNERGQSLSAELDQSQTELERLYEQWTQVSESLEESQ